MDALRRKLHDQRGVSMLMALLLMLVALMVSAVVVAGASSAVSALRTDQKQEQAALTVTSAAELIRNSFLASDMKYVSTTVSYEFYYNSNQNTSSTTTQTIPAELAFSDFANYAIGRLRDGQPVLNRVYTFHLEDDRVSDVTATFSMTYDTLDSGETSYVLTAALESTDPDAPYRMTLVMPSAVTTSTFCQRPALLQDDHHRRDHFMDRWRHHPSKGGGLMRKLRSRRGETLVETLVSLLIVVLVMAFLATSIVAATRVNAKVRDADVAVRYDGISEPASLTVSSGRGTSSFTVPVEKYTTENGYCYYTYDGN